MKKMTFKFPKKFDCVMSANMPVRSGKTFINKLLQNCDTAVFYDPTTSLSCLYQKIGRGLAF